MAKATLTGNALVITSAVKAADLEVIAKYAPAALTLKEKDEDSGKLVPVFKVAYGSVASASAFGICFDGKTRDENGFATATFEFTGSQDAAAATAEIADKYGATLAKLNKVEATIPEVLKKVAADRKQVVEAITVA